MCNERTPLSPYQFFHFIAMKLHLPKGLRTALLAVVTLGSSVCTVQAAPASYDYGVVVTSDPCLVEDTSGVHQTYYFSTQNWNESWVCSFYVDDFMGAPCVDSELTGGCVVVGNKDVPYKVSQIKGGNVTKPSGMKDYEFAIYFTPSGKIYCLTKSSKTLIGEDPKGFAALNAGITPFQITLNWVVNDDGTGSLYYTGGSLASVTDGGIIQKTDTTGFETGKITILDGVELTSENLSAMRNIFTTGGADAVLNRSLDMVLNWYVKGSESDDPAMWQITGQADLTTLTSGGESGYLDMTAENTPVRTLKADESVHFIGNTGVIHTTEDAVFSNNTVATEDVLNGGTTASVGFGAVEGKTLTVERAAIANSVLNSVAPCALRVVDKGTVKLALGDDGATITNLIMKDDSTLELNTVAANDVAVSLNGGEITTGNIVRTGSGNLVLEFTEANKNAVLTSISSTATASDIVIQCNEETGGSGSLKTQSISNTNGNIEISVGTTVAGAINADAGNIKIDGGCKVSTGSAMAGDAIEVRENSVLSSTNIEARMVFTDGTSLVTTDSITAAWVTEAGDITVYRDGSGELLKGNVIISADGIQADSVAEGALINLGIDSTSILVTRKLTDSKVQVGSATIITGATTEDLIRISTTSAETSGVLEANEVALTDEYSLSAAVLKADFIDAGGATITAAADEKAELFEVQMTARSLTADSIKAANLEVAEGYTVNNVIVDATTEVTVNGGAILNHVSFLGNVKSAGNGETELNAVKFQGGSRFGGEQGDYVVDPETQGVESVVLTGTLTGSDLTISSMVLNAEELLFAEGEKEVTYTILETDGKTITYEPDVTNYELYIQSYVRAELVTDGNTVKIVGEEDEAGIKAELTGTANSAATMKAIESPDQDMEPGSSLSELYKYIGHVNRYSQEERAAVLEALSGASLTALADSQRRGLRAHQDNLRNRIIQMGGGTNAGLTTDWQYAGIQAWAQADGSFSTSDGSGDECGYDFDTWGATVGANMDLTANTVVGLAFSASYGEIKSDGADHASGNNDAQYISLYARHQKERWVQMLILTAGMNDMDMERRVLGYTAEGDTEGTTLSAYYELGYTIGLNYEFSHILQPMVSVSVTSAKVDGYTEKGSIGNAGLTYDGDSYVYGKVGIGARYQGVMYETVHERNAIVEARVLVTRDFGDTTESAKVALGASGMYEVTGADTSGTGFELGVGFSLPVEQHTTIYADADMTMTPDYTGFRGNIGVRYDF